MSNLSPAALALEADLRLLTKLPRQMSADLNDIKERVFGSKDGVPRTEEQSRWRYVDAIVKAFNASGATSIDTFDYDVRRYAALCARMSIVLEEHAAALATLDKAHERIKRLQEINERLETRNREAEQAGASFGVETCGLLAEKDAEIERLRSDLIDTRTAYAKLAADAEQKEQKIAALDSALAQQFNGMKALRADITAEQGRTERLRAVVADLIADLNVAKGGAE